MTDIKFNLTADMVPTEATVLADLKAGKYAMAVPNCTANVLVGELMMQGPAVWKHQEKFVEYDHPDIVQELVAAYRLVSIIGGASADKLTSTGAVSLETEAQKSPREILVRTVRGARDLAKEAKLPLSYFQIKFPEGDASNLVVPAEMLVRQLKKHGGDLNSPRLVAELTRDAEAAALALTSSEIRQETGKLDAQIPTTIKGMAMQALYARLLKFARVGRTILRNDPEEAAKFSLSLFGNGGSAAASSDDEGDVVDTEATPKDANATPATTDAGKVKVPG